MCVCVHKWHLRACQGSSLVSVHEGADGQAQNPLLITLHTVPDESIAVRSMHVYDHVRTSEVCHLQRCMISSCFYDLSRAFMPNLSCAFMPDLSIASASCQQHSSHC